MVLQTVQMAHDYITTIHEDANMFATLFFAVLDLATGQLTYVNGGHNSPLLVRPDGSISELEPTGPVVGMFPSHDFQVANATMEKGDLLFIYTDGATDCINETQELYGENRLIDFVKQNAAMKAEELLNALMAELTRHMNGCDQFDDITLTAIKR
jgi:serine phosphatase RsbU (regulator of sigma subunit)